MAQWYLQSDQSHQIPNRSDFSHFSWERSNHVQSYCRLHLLQVTWHGLTRAGQAWLLQTQLASRMKGSIHEKIIESWWIRLNSKAFTNEMSLCPHDHTCQIAFFLVSRSCSSLHKHGTAIWNCDSQESESIKKVASPFCLYFRWSFFTLELVAVVFGAARLFLSLAALTVMISSAILWNKYR